jgi:hypothetical protein
MKWDIKDEKVTGFILIFAGVILFIYGLILVFNISEGMEVPLDIFKENQLTNIDPSYGDSQYYIRNPDVYFKQMFTPMFPVLNFMMWISLIFFIIGAGIRVIRIGIRILKTSVELNVISKHELEDIKNIVNNLK